MSQEQISISGAGGVTLPLVKILTGRGFVTGKSGSGKSNSVNVIVEETLDLGRPVLIIDTDGEYWGLKEQYRMLHLGNDDRCDATVTAADADTIVDVALGEGVPTILDVSGFLREEDADEIIHRVVKRLFQQEKKYREPFLLIAEEVHEYIPEKGGSSDAGETLIQVAKRGRKHGLGFIGVSQRPASVDKDFITQCDWITWHRLTWKNDTEVVRTLLGSDASEEIEGLDPGEAMLMTDWDEQVQQVQFRKKRTFDAGQTPGFDEFDPPELLPVAPDVLERFGVKTDREIPDPESEADDEKNDEERAVFETQPVEDAGEADDSGEEPGDGAGEVVPDEADADVETPDAPEVVDAEPVAATNDGGGTEVERASRDAGGRSAPRRATPASTRRRRSHGPPRDQPAIVEFGQMVIYLSTRVGQTISGTIGSVAGAVGGRVGSWWADGNVDEDDLIVVGWLVLVVLFVSLLAVGLAVAI